MPRQREKEGEAWVMLQVNVTSRNPSTPKDWCQDSWGPDQFPAPKSPSENNYHLFNSRF